MRTREEIEVDLYQPSESARAAWMMDRLICELLLDIRELLQYPSPRQPRP